MTRHLRSVDSIAQQQLGLMTTRQWLAGGGTYDELAWAVRRGRIVRVRRGVYRMAGAPITRDQEVLAACLAAGPSAVASHGSAGELWGLWGWIRAETVELTAFGGPHPELGGVLTHRVPELPLGHRRECRGIPATSPARTVCDLAPRLRSDVLERTVDDAQRRRLLRLPELHQCALSLVAEGRPLLGPLVDLLGRLGLEHHAGGSRSELRVLEVCRAAGLDLPLQEVHLDVDGHELIPDYLYPYELIVIEYQGGAHWTPAAKRRDRRKRNLYSQAGLLVLEFSDGDSDATIASEIWSALQSRRTLADAGGLPPTSATIQTPTTRHRSDKSA